MAALLLERVLRFACLRTCGAMTSRHHAQLPFLTGPSGYAQLLVLCRLEMFQVLVQRALVELGQKFSLRCRIVVTNFIDQLTFVHKRVLSYIEIGMGWRTS